MGREDRERRSKRKADESSDDSDNNNNDEMKSNNQSRNRREEAKGSDNENKKTMDSDDDNDNNNTDSDSDSNDDNDNDDDNDKNKSTGGGLAAGLKSKFGRFTINKGNKDKDVVDKKAADKNDKSSSSSSKKNKKKKTNDNDNDNDNHGNDEKMSSKKATDSDDENNNENENENENKNNDSQVAEKKNKMTGLKKRFTGFGKNKKKTEEPQDDSDNSSDNNNSDSDSDDIEKGNRKKKNKKNRKKKNRNNNSDSDNDDDNNNNNSSDDDDSEEDDKNKPSNMKRFSSTMRKSFRGTPKKNINNNNNNSDSDSGDDENSNNQVNNAFKDTLAEDPDKNDKIGYMRRTPLEHLKARKGMLQRVVADKSPEVHILGEVTGATGFDSSGISCKFVVETGKFWGRIAGQETGQTQYIYKDDDSDMAVWNHPLDLHYTAFSIQGWPRFIVQVWQLDPYGRSDLVGYGFVHIPTTPGHHNVSISCWRPTGSLQDEVASFFLGVTPRLANDDLIFAKAWDQRSHLVTLPSGTVHLDINVILRHFNDHNVDVPR